MKFNALDVRVVRRVLHRQRRAVRRMLRGDRRTIAAPPRKPA